jgi:ribonuclease HI
MQNSQQLSLLDPTSLIPPHQSASFKFDATLYTEGACTSLGFGGWAFILEANGRRIEQFGYECETTNIRMNLLAAFEGVVASPRTASLQIISDSGYVVKGVNEWLPSWLNNGWKTANGQPVKYRTFWEEIHQQLNGRVHRADWLPVTSANPILVRCHKLAKTAMVRH